MSLPVPEPGPILEQNLPTIDPISSRNSPTVAAAPAQNPRMAKPISPELSMADSILASEPPVVEPITIPSPGHAPHLPSLTISTSVSSSPAQSEFSHIPPASSVTSIATPSSSHPSYTRNRLGSKLPPPPQWTRKASGTATAALVAGAMVAGAGSSSNSASALSLLAKGTKAPSPPKPQGWGQWARGLFKGGN